MSVEQLCCDVKKVVVLLYPNLNNVGNNKLVNVTTAKTTTTEAVFYINTFSSETLFTCELISNKNNKSSMTKVDGRIPHIGAPFVLYDFIIPDNELLPVEDYYKTLNFTFLNLINKSDITGFLIQLYNSNNLLISEKAVLQNQLPANLSGSKFVFTIPAPVLPSGDNAPALLIDQITTTSLIDVVNTIITLSDGSTYNYNQGSNPISGGVGYYTNNKFPNIIISLYYDYANNIQTFTFNDKTTYDKTSLSIQKFSTFSINGTSVTIQLFNNDRMVNAPYTINNVPTHSNTAIPGIIMFGFQTTPYQTTPYVTTPYKTTPYVTTPYKTTPYVTTPFVLNQNFSELKCNTLC